MNKFGRAGLLVHASLALSLGAGIAGSAFADELAMPAPAASESKPMKKHHHTTKASSETASGLPRRGESMSAVVHQFGEPATKHAAAGGDSPKHPPITRWDYPAFSVFFEHSHVIDAVVPGEPPAIQHSEQLKSAN